MDLCRTYSTRRHALHSTTYRRQLSCSVFGEVGRVGVEACPKEQAVAIVVAAVAIVAEAVEEAATMVVTTLVVTRQMIFQWVQLGISRWIGAPESVLEALIRVLLRVLVISTSRSVQNVPIVRPTPGTFATAFALHHHLERATTTPQVPHKPCVLQVLGLARGHSVANPSTYASQFHDPTMHYRSNGALDDLSFGRRCSERTQRFL